MKHPTHDDWMSYLYHEMPSEQYRELDAHLATCAECREQVSAWRGTLGALDEWSVPPAQPLPSPVPVLPKVVRWAAAAAVVMGIGIGIGRLTTPQVDVAALSAGIEERMKQSFDQRIQELQTAGNAARDRDREEWAALLEEIQTQHDSDYTSLRQDLETVAVAAENRLYQTERQLVQLAGTPATRRSSVTQ